MFRAICYVRDDDNDFSLCSNDSQLPTMYVFSINQPAIQPTNNPTNQPTNQLTTRSSFSIRNYKNDTSTSEYMKEQKKSIQSWNGFLIKNLWQQL